MAEPIRRESVARQPGEEPVAAELERKIADGSARVAVVGMGYVGLPLGLAFVDAGFRVHGVDVDAEKVLGIRCGRSHVTDVSDEELGRAVSSSRLVPTTDWSTLAEADVVVICVPTPLRKTKDPDLTMVIAATEQVAGQLHPGQLVVLESTTYPGTTEEVVLPKLEESGLEVGTDFFLGFSPERVDPGNERFKTREIPKVVSGVTETCAGLAAQFYGRSHDRVVPVSCTRVAEMVKLLENTFRAVNIALVNEMAQMCAQMKIDVWEVISAAASKPFGFMPFYPGPGLGGHCIPIDPAYLQWKARIDGFEPQFIQLAQQVNGEMPRHVARRAMEVLNDVGRALHGSKVHLLGVTYKRDIGDVRESPALEILHHLIAHGAEVSYTDPFAPEIRLDGRTLASEPASPEKLAASDLVLIVTDHTSFDYAAVVEHSSLVFDTRNATAHCRAPHVHRL